VVGIVVVTRAALLIARHASPWLGFHVRLKTPDGMRGARIAFLREVSNPADTRKVLVDMVEQARSQAKREPKSGI